MIKTKVDEMSKKLGKKMTSKALELKVMSLNVLKTHKNIKGPVCRI